MENIYIAVDTKVLFQVEYEFSRKSPLATFDKLFDKTGIGHTMLTNFRRSGKNVTIIVRENEDQCLVRNVINCLVENYHLNESEIGKVSLSQLIENLPTSMIVTCPFESFAVTTVINKIGLRVTTRAKLNI